MNKLITKLLMGVFCILSTVEVNAQVTVAGSAGAANGVYATLKLAFDGLNLETTQAGNNITVSITASTAEVASAVLNQPSVSSWASLTISPTGGAARTISGAITGSLIDLNGADNVTIDGLNTGGNSLIISNTSTGAANTIRFINDASNNIIQNSTLQGSATNVLNGVVFFSTGITTGNDGNNINNCSITAAGANLPVNGIYSLGTGIGVDNSGNTINANFISDYFNAALVSIGINLATTGNSAWTITNNRLFQTATRLVTTSNTYNGIFIGTGAGYTVTGNIIGFANAAGTGTTNIVGNSVALTGTFPSSYTTTGTATATRYIAINCAFLAAGAVSSIQNNTIAGFALYTSSGAATTNGIFCGININSGNVNIGTVTGNTIGATTGNGSIYAACTNPGGAIVGIFATSVNTVNIRNNTIGALDAMGTTATGNGGITGINTAGIFGNFDISGNTIGNATVDNLRTGNLNTGANLSNVGTTFGISSGTGIIYGILNSATGGITIGTPALPNIIRNASNNSSSTTATFRGIENSGGNLGFSISSNIISNLTTQSTSVSLGNGALTGLGIYNSTVTTGLPGSSIILNTITGLSLTNATATGTNIAGISIAALAVDILRNKICDIRNASTSVATLTPGTATGIFQRSATAGAFENIANNMISLGNAQTTNTCFIGIWLQCGSTPNPISNIYHNTINIEGAAAAGAQPSFDVLRGSFALTMSSGNLVPVDIRNNILNNTRTGGTGGHYAISNLFGTTTVTGGTLATGWGVNASNYNVLNAANPAKVGNWTTDQTFAGWKTASASDANSVTAVPVTFVSTCDLHLNMGATATVLESHGATGLSITNDIDGQVRPGGGVLNGGGFAPDLGADEFDGTYIDDLGPTISYTLLTNTTSTANRTTTSFAAITDAAGVNATAGTRPRIYYKLSTDANTFNNNTNATAGWKFAEASGITSPFNFTIDYSLLFGSPVISTGNVIQYFVVAQDLAGTPNVGINSGTFTAAPASVALTVAAFPINGTINQYNITAGFSGIVTVPGTYPTLTGVGGLFEAINASVLTGNVTVNITANLTEDGTNALNQWGEQPAASNFTLTINPDAAVVRIITGTVPAGMIRFNGADRVTVDGRFGGSGKFLSFINTDATFVGSCFNLLNGATNNTLKYALMQAVTISDGSVIFGTTTSVGNSNNTVDNCTITAFNGVTIGNVCISSTGSVGNENINNTISNNELVEFGSRAVDIAVTGTTAWSIINNSLYHPGGGVNFGAGAGSIFGLRLQGGGNYTITGNFIGGSAALATGANPVFSSTAALVTYTGISAALTTGTSNIKGNIIKGTTINCVPTAAVGAVYAGITASGLGAANIGGAVAGEGNTIGSNTANSSIVLTTTTAATTSTTQLNGINSSGTGNLIRGNTIGGYDINNLGAAPAATTFFGIVSTGFTAVPPMLITDNIVGSNGAGAVANSIRFLASSISTAPGIVGITAQGNAVATNITNNFIKNISNQSTTSSGSFSGLLVSSPISFPVVVTGNTIDNINSVSNVNGTTYTAISSSVANSTINISNNTISNITQAGSSINAIDRGVLHSGTSVATISSNTISNLSTSGAFVTTPAGVVTGAQGILLTSPNSATIAQNTISGIANNNTGALATSASAIGVNNATSATITRNTISDIINTSTGTTVTTPPTASGIIFAVPASNINISNNFIALGNAQTTNTEFNGLWVVTSGTYTVNAHFNSISISGAAAAGALPSFALLRGDNSGTAVTSNINLRDNILSNTRTGGTGRHYAIANQSTVASTTGWPSTASNYNDLAAVAPLTVGLWGAVDQTFATWQVISAGDANSLTVAPVFTSATDLHLVPASNLLLNNFGTTVASLTQDYDVQTRNLTTPDMGADEFMAPNTASWIGGVSVNWATDANNWEAAVVPIATTNVTVPTAPAFMPQLQGAVTINDLALQGTARVSLNGQTFTINGAITGTGTFSGSSTSNLTLGGIAGTVNFDPTSAATRSLNNLTLNAPANATLGSAVDIFGTIQLVGGAQLHMAGQNVTLKSNATNTARIANLTGQILDGETNVTMERFIKLRAGGVGRAYRLLAPTVNTTGTMRANWMEGGMNTVIGTNVNPVANYGTQITGASGNTNFFDVTTSNASSAYFTTNGVTPTYTAIGSTTVGTGIATMNALTGYFLYVRGDRSMNMTLPLNPATNPTSSTTLRTTGTLLTGTKTQADFAAMDATNLALNLVTNPYASPIDWSLVRGDAGTTFLSTSYTVWDANLGSRGGFATVTTGGVASGGSGANQFIQPGQAFFVQTSGGVPTIAIKETHKAAGNNNTVFLVPPQTFGVALYYNESTGYRRQADGVIAMYDNNYSTAIDANDAAEINNWDENIAIDRDGKHLAIEARPVIVKSDDLPLFMNNMKKQAYEFEFTPASFTNTNLKAELIDNYLGTRTLLSVTSPTVVSFTITDAPASKATDRFKVVFGAFGSSQGVDAITVKASQQNSGVQVDWTSKTETDMVRYEVEKQTYGTPYSKVNTTNALGNSTSPVNYNWFDANPVMGYNFYRIKGIDKAGNVRYSDMVKVLFGKGEPGIVVYPNPIEGNVFKVDLNNLAKGTYLVDLYNTSGQKVYTGQIQHDGSILVTKVINLNGDVSKGVYQLQLSSDNGFRTTQKIIKN